MMMIMIRVVNTPLGCGSESKTRPDRALEKYKNHRDSVWVAGFEPARSRRLQDFKSREDGRTLRPVRQIGSTLNLY